MKKLNVVDLFSGCGGISKGFEEAGFNILLGVDNWEDALKTFEYNHKSSKILNTDISKLSGKDILKRLNNNEVDVVVGGPPCQGFSLAGNRKRDDERNLLVFHFARLINELQPKAFVMENVLGILSMAEGKIKKDLMNEFSRIGYNVLEPKGLFAHHYGVPQIRRRVFFIGIRKDINKSPSYPIPTHYDKETNQLDLIPKRVKPSVNVWQAISDLDFLKDEDKEETIRDYEIPPESEYQKEMRNKSQKVYNHSVSNHTEQTKKVISFVPEGGNWENLPKKYQNIRSYSNTWKRLHPRKPSVTIDCGHRHHFHYKANRVQTVRESARIQSFNNN